MFYFPIIEAFRSAPVECKLRQYHTGVEKRVEDFECDTQPLGWESITVGSMLTSLKLYTMAVRSLKLLGGGSSRFRRAPCCCC